MTAGPITYCLEDALSPADFIDVLQRSTLAERRPVQDAERIAGMLRHADIIVSARTANDRLVGIARAVTDYHYCCYLSDLAVDVAWQGHGIGQALIRETHIAAGLQTSLYLVAAPKARTYYPHIGMTHHDSCWYIPASAPPQAG